MPELPEVETVCRSLRPFLIGKTVEKCEVKEEKLIKSSTAAEFVQDICGSTFTALRFSSFCIFIIILLVAKNILDAHLTDFRQF